MRYNIRDHVGRKIHRSGGDIVGVLKLHKGQKGNPWLPHGTFKGPVRNDAWERQPDPGLALVRAFSRHVPGKRMHAYYAEC